MKKSFILTVLVSIMMLTIASAETVLYDSFFLGSKNNKKLYKHNVDLNDSSLVSRFGLRGREDIGSRASKCSVSADDNKVVLQFPLDWGFEDIKNIKNTDKTLSEN